jgi:hypothetical protein
MHARGTLSAHRVLSEIVYGLIRLFLCDLQRFSATVCRHIDPGAAPSVILLRDGNLHEGLLVAVA